ncbi:MAG: hypothetical protein R2873_29635 [Caldilineaceae bacterium]
MASARVWEFYTVVRLPNGEGSLLSNVKAVEPGYPFYGEVVLASGRPFADELSGGSVIVEQALLDRLGLAVGDLLEIGQATLPITDVVLVEPDRPVNFFDLGPRIFVASVDLDALDLVKPGSRVSYSTLLRVDDESRLDAVARSLAEARDVGQESIQTYRTAPSGVQSFFDNLIFFLSLVAIFTLLLSGIGIRNVDGLSARTLHHHRHRQDAGSRGRFVAFNFCAIVAALARWALG